MKIICQHLMRSEVDSEIKYQKPFEEMQRTGDGVFDLQ